MRLELKYRIKNLVINYQMKIILEKEVKKE